MHELDLFPSQKKTRPVLELDSLNACDVKVIETKATKSQNVLPSCASSYSVQWNVETNVEVWNDRGQSCNPDFFWVARKWGKKEL